MRPHPILQFVAAITLVALILVLLLLWLGCYGLAF